MDSQSPPPPPSTEVGTPSSSAPAAGKMTFGERFHELLYPLAIAVISFVVSFVVGVGAATAVASGLASRLLALVDDAIAYSWQLVDVYQRLGLVAAGATFANAVASAVDNRLEEVTAQYKPANLDSVIKTLLVGDRKDVAAYKQYPFLGMILVPLMATVLFFFMCGVRVVRNLQGYKALVDAAGKLKQ
ncbi:uncharacterized protein SPSK_08027 [Sporothrix schenckii 1099-18]|uniref:Uncharacterized protein n=2 Tax=Sporothrix schenckii TaxID=29908 RepID=U7Q1M3_SPOS1|nr:uncharacterized protein SPSK_08027 [Sporothrix schenckii 1099-18]ERT01077.1 hypothetical protein HMPREF1624_02314 [Sporothrix schenckii ATCC 58251]KJR88210.1 hypothetical protein SPSK_08027 [Sporothrix schenckii 1099-18]